MTEGAEQGDDVTEVLKVVVDSFEHEKRVCKVCRESRLSRVVVAIVDGEVWVDRKNPFSRVPYLIFELANGDVRDYLDATAEFDAAWVLRTLHHVATGLGQLHRLGIAHQDTKPSNILTFADRTRKLGDLGRSSSKTSAALHDEITVPGDPHWAPPELLYGQIDADWNRRRSGCDLYQLGSLILFFWHGAGATALLLDKIEPQYRPEEWTGTYNDVLPFLRSSFEEVLFHFRQGIEGDLKDVLPRIVKELCDPDPVKRGHPGERAANGNPMSLERYISDFNLFASRAELKLRGANAKLPTR
jgi:serine/threonine protein kinase